MNYNENLKKQANQIFYAYQDLIDVLVYFDAFNEKDFIENQMVLDSASMFIQRVLNSSLNNEISHFISPSKTNIGNIRNDFSHEAKKFNSKQIYDICIHYLNQKETIEFYSNKKIENHKFKNRIDFKISEKKEKFINQIADDDEKLMLSKAILNLSRAKHYLKKEKIDRYNISKKNISFNAVCFNIMNAREHLKLASLKNANDFYKNYPNLKKVRDKIAHKFLQLQPQDLFLALDDLLEICKSETSKKIVKESKNKI